MRTMRCSVIIPVIILIAGISDTIHAQVSTPGDMKSVMYADWVALLTAVQTVSWESVSEARSAKEGEDQRVYRIDQNRFLYQRDFGRLFRNSYQRPNESDGRRSFSDVITLTNAHYSAELQRPKAEVDDWLLKRVTLKPTLPEPTSSCFPWMTVSNLMLLYCLPDACFVVTRTEPSPDRTIDPTALRVHFACDRSKGTPHEAMDFLQSGYVDVDSAHHFRPTRFEYHTTNSKMTATTTGTVEYGSSTEWPVIRAASVSNRSVSQLKGTILGKEVTTYKNVRYNEPVDEDEFWLTHYRLPEPIGVVRETSTPTFVWLLVAAAGFAGVAVLFRWLARRNNPRNPAPVQP